MMLAATKLIAMGRKITPLTTLVADAVDEQRQQQPEADQMSGSRIIHRTLFRSASSVAGVVKKRV